MVYSSPVQVRGVRPFSLANAADFSSISGRNSARSAAIQSLTSVQFGAVPLLHPRRAATFVVTARQLEVLHQAQVAHGLEARVVDIQVLQAPAAFFAIERALAEFGLGGADRFHRHGGVHQA